MLCPEPWPFRSGAGWLAPAAASTVGCAAFCPAGADVTLATAAGAAKDGEFTACGLCDDGVTAGAGAAVAVGELAAADDAAATGAACAGAAPLGELPWLGSTVNTMAAAAAATTNSVMAPAIIPVRKLTSSSWALMAARTPGRMPTAL